jgi:hypothetical protein
VADDAKRANPAIDKPNAAPPPAADAPESAFAKNEDEYQVYEPADIPTKVLADLVEARSDSIGSLRDVAYGFRRIGQGNHAWFVKTKSGTTLQVSYGGRAKTGATIGTPSQFVEPTPKA